MINATGFMRSLPTEAASVRQWEGEWKSALRLRGDFRRKRYRHGLRQVAVQWRGRAQGHRPLHRAAVEFFEDFVFFAGCETGSVIGDAEDDRVVLPRSRRPRSAFAEDCSWRSWRAARPKPVRSIRHQLKSPANRCWPRPPPLALRGQPAPPLRAKVLPDRTIPARAGGARIRDAWRQQIVHRIR